MKTGSYCWSSHTNTKRKKESSYRIILVGVIIWDISQIYCIKTHRLKKGSITRDSESQQRNKSLTCWLSKYGTWTRWVAVLTAGRTASWPGWPAPRRPWQRWCLWGLQRPPPRGYPCWYRSTTQRYVSGWKYNNTWMETQQCHNIGGSAAASGLAPVCVYILLQIETSGKGAVMCSLLLSTV